MPTGPSKPALPPLAERPAPPPKPMSVSLESIRERERISMSKKKGYMSTIATRPGGLGSLNVREERALGA